MCLIVEYCCSSTEDALLATLWFYKVCKICKVCKDISVQRENTKLLSEFRYGSLAT